MTEITLPEQTPETGAAVAPTNRKRSVRIWQTVFVLILVGFVTLLALRLVQTNQSEHRADGVAPEFTFTTFEGETISLSDLRGQGVVLNFWASWCDPCRDEAALLEATWRRLTKELSELRASQTASTRTGQADIEALVGKIVAIEARLAHQAQLAHSTT